MVKAGIGGALGIGFVSWLGVVSGIPLLIAPFGATAVLVFAVPDSPLAQPANVIGGHMLATIVSMGLYAVLPHTWWAIGLAVGGVIFLKAALRLTHPPAGADPIVVFLSDPGLDFLYLIVPTGAIVLVAIAVAIHRFPPRGVYPLPSRQVD